MRYWMWPRRLRLKRRPPKVRRLVRKRRLHRSARERLRDFGLSRYRYLWFVPILIVMIIVAACIRLPKTTTELIQSAAAQSESVPGGISIRSAKYRPSIPAGYTLAVDLSWRAEAPAQELLAELMLRDGTGVVAARETTAIEPGALNGLSPLTRAELDIPYNLNGIYHLSVRVLDAEGRTVLDEIQFGALNVY